MTKNELMNYLNINMMNSLRQRDKTDPMTYLEEYGYHNGQYRAYEMVIGMLATIDIQTPNAGDSRNMHQA